MRADNVGEAMSRSDIDHYSDLEIWGPVAADDLWHLLEPLSLRRGLRVLDVGCGKAAMLIQLAERLGAHITGVDHSAAALQQAREDLARRVPDADATWVQRDMNELDFDADAFDLVMALGGPYRNDSLEETLRLYAQWVRSDGHVLHGDGFWMQPPPAAYLDATGLPHDALFSREGSLDVARRCGLESKDHWIASREAWDHFEGTILRNHESYAREHAGDPEVEAMIARKRAWDDAQQRWGRDTMAFCVDVFRRR